MSSSKTKSYLSNEYISDSESSGDEVEQEFQPPKNFEELTSKQTSKVDFKNKEVWLFKLPKGLNLKGLSGIPISFDFNSSTVFTTPNDNKQYSLQEDISQEDLTSKSKNSKYTILSSSKKEPAFKVLKNKPINRFYTISEKVSIPDINFEKARIQRKNVIKEENLRMRHFPTGYSAKDFKEAQILGKESSEEPEMEIFEDAKEEQDEKEFKVPKQEQVTKKSKKEKKDKKDKKSKKHSSK
ncbi:hypothetical protein PACTADRAFT_4010 [Pachysolen tannophilus NRRL Y-2460]|uniref:DNA-directed RNA polymerase I subunit RPA34 n=1 Tax=Pachysolen tannophilus NRRL Y-2460 TaxID=669874 RepID=A0A1E4TQN0_PACTA|nr:hypothetical protein PACTADRAFT_4010 [Pachysolen tannophilus NRRL Y-2460]